MGFHPFGMAGYSKNSSDISACTTESRIVRTPRDYLLECNSNMIPIRFYIFGAIALAFVGLAVALKVQTGRVGALKSEKAQLQSLVIAQQENLKKANEASERYAISLENLKAARAVIPTRSVRLCVNSSVSEAGTAPGADASSAERLQEALGSNIKASRDIGRELYDLADEADLCPAKLEALQQWIRDR